MAPSGGADGTSGRQSTRREEQMIVHTIDIRESGPDGLVAILEPHDFERQTAVEMRLVSEAHAIVCCVVECKRMAGGEVTVHRRHSKRPTETVYLCAEHIEWHSLGDTLRLRMESNR